ncbi:hypothetical protein [Variovorax sp. 38R]|uniref:hypothetical protein n=1 Tax=Variovorax sp. 38R TaxID=2774875 RepID=UPI00177CDB2B|nr:hypothetical protein [Variovorax sp. 38R]QOF76167.1 hypothetical protein IG196_17395 [Variovorax sp. 38R]
MRSTSSSPEFQLGFSSQISLGSDVLSPVRAPQPLLSLVRRYGKERLAADSLIALELGTVKYVHVKAILVNERDQSAASKAPSWISPLHELVRGPAYYQ